MNKAKIYISRLVVLFLNILPAHGKQVFIMAVIGVNRYIDGFTDTQDMIVLVQYVDHFLSHLPTIPHGNSRSLSFNGMAISPVVMTPSG